MSILGAWANNTVRRPKPFTLDEQALALDLFRDTKGITADPEHDPSFWALCLEDARSEMAEYDLDQEERTGAPVEG
jgi:hypothetical protein